MQLPKIMIVRKRLIQIAIITLVFAITTFLAIYQVAKGARFHQLNYLHLKYIIELNELRPTITKYGNREITQIRNVIQNIKTQPADCMALINTFDRLIMRLINTGIAIELCEKDLVVADYALSSLDRFESNQIGEPELIERLTYAAKVFKNHSDEFEHPIARTVEWIVILTWSTVVLLSLMTCLILFSAVRSISNSVRLMKNTSDALEESEKLNKKLAHFDRLTGLPNRNLFIDRIQHQIEHATRKNSTLALLFIDLDRFKDINDSMGHQAGDELIRHAGQRLSQCIRASDTCARIGGDEFNIILNDIGRATDAATVAQDIVACLSRPFTIFGQDVHVSGSVGIAIFPNDATDFVHLQKYADLAMYQAKSKGRSRYEFYSRQLEQQITTKVNMVRCLRGACKNNEFSLLFQPVVDLRTLRISGVEALLRWHSPELGDISPVNFIPLAEETGLISEIGEWVLTTTFIQAKPWVQKIPGFSVAVNVSPNQLRNTNFVQTVQNALEHTGFQASALSIEITENVRMDELNGVNTLEALSAMGVRLLLDDFGTGHSSLSYLHKLPFDVLKVDRSFVSKQSYSLESRNLIASIVAMAHELGLEVIAEGIESYSDLQLLQNLNCEHAQGYFFDRPMPAHDIDCEKVYLSIDSLDSVSNLN